MAKEHLIDHYGTLRFTIGTGCSGGSLAQQPSVTICGFAVSESCFLKPQAR